MGDLHVSLNASTSETNVQVFQLSVWLHSLENKSTYILASSNGTLHKVQNVTTWALCQTSKSLLNFVHIP